MLIFLVIMLIVGAVPCLIGFIFLKHSLGDRWTAAIMARVPTSPASAVARMRPGQLVEVKGTLRCPEPLTSELAHRPCAYVRSWVERTYEYEDRDVNDEPRIAERTEIVASYADRVPFFVEDETGRVPVAPDGAEIGTDDVYDRYREGMSVGAITLAGRTVEMNHGFGTLGYRIREAILPIDGPVYVLGVVTRDGGIGRPGRGRFDAAFIISPHVPRSEEGAPSPPRGDRLILWCGVGALAGGLLIMAVGVIAWLIWG
jgi:hypothetical protein